MLSLSRSYDFIEVEDVEFPEELLLEPTREHRRNNLTIEGTASDPNAEDETPEQRERRIKKHQKRVREELKARGLKCLIH